MNIPPEATQAQTLAAQPDRSSWVAANAGSGKTRVLTNRVARLLLRRTDPQKILCLTFTKAAAAEMQIRLFKQLGRWSMLADTELRKELAELGAEDDAANTDDLREARRLFARALETPGGLKIQTIHAFCDQLLRRFPLEAGVSPDFTEMDKVRTRQVSEAVLDELVQSHDGPCFDDVAQILKGADPADLIDGVLSARASFRAPLDADKLRRAIGAPEGQTPQSILRDVLATVDGDDLRAFCAILESGSTNDKKAFHKLKYALGETHPEAALAGLETVFLFGETTKSEKSYTSKAGEFPTKATWQANIELVSRIGPLMAAVETARTTRLALAAYTRALALNRFARAFLARYDAKKTALGLMDFDDLIDKAGALLVGHAAADWVRYRLDGGIDHVLVDEAQDTSPAQWQVIDAVTAEFFTGQGARGAGRTIFAVGDFKQSIYSFQGAEPANFTQKRDKYRDRIEGIGEVLQDCALLHSFRSAPPILALVDRIFSGPERGGVEDEILHLPAYAEKPGRVDLWPFVTPPEKAEPKPWFLPVDMPAENDHRRVLAVAISRKIRCWLDAGKRLPGGDKAIRPGDILILVQRRKELFHYIIKALKEAGVAVAGADRLKIGEELAVRDLLSLLRFLTTPADDLSLAEVLRSPIFGLSEGELYLLAHGRDGTLWQALRQSADRFEGTVGTLRDLLRFADYERPFELLERVLVRHDARGRILARLGAEAEDALDELLSQALAYENTEAPTLTGFLERMQSEEIEIVRQTDDRSDQVRVMTVHGAKGLESPIVILPDTLKPQGGKSTPVLKLPDGLAAWRKRDAMPPSLQAPRDLLDRLADEERMRLFYVAMTRAENWLIVCGCGAQNRRAGSWYDRVSEAMDALGATDGSEVPGLDGPVKTFAPNWRDEVAASDGQAGTAAPRLPPWALEPAEAPQKAEPRPLRPSELGGDHSLQGEAEPEADALRRGNYLHLLLEGLPRVADKNREGAARRILLNAGATEQDDDLAHLAAEAISVLRAPGLAAVFASGAVAEVPLTAKLTALGGQRISGRIDRLVVSDHEVLAVDFKSNRLVPASPEDVPEGLLRQMGAYHAALCQIWPDRLVRTALLWTATPSLMLLPDEIVIAALRRAGEP